MKKQNSFEEKLKEQLDSMELKPSDALWSKIEQNIDATTFEPKLQEKLANYSVEPRQEVWEGVESQLPDAPKRRGILWYSTALLLLVGTFVAGFYVNQNLQKNELVQTEITDRQQLIDNSAASDAEVIKPNIASKSQEPNSAKSSSNNINANSGLNQTNESNKKIIADEQDVITNKLNHKKSSAPKSDILNKNKPLSKKDKLVQTKTKPAQTEEAPKTKNGGASKSNNTLNIPPVSDGINHATSGANSNASSNISALTEPKKVGVNPQVEKPISEPGNKLTETPKAPEPKVILESVNINPNPKDTFAEDKLFRGSAYVAPEEVFTKFSLSAYAEMHMSFMQLIKPNSNTYGDLQKSYDLRKEMESPALDFAGGLLLNYHLGKSWIISSGIGISSFKQNVKFNVLPAVQSTPSLVQPRNLYVNPNDSIIAGSSNTLENKYSFTEIPLLVTYQFFRESNVHLELTGGVSYGRLNLVNAYMPDPGCIGILVATDKSSFPEFKNVFFASFAPSVAFDLNSSVALGLMPNVKVSMTSMVNNPNWIQQRPYSMGLGFFLRKKF
ncbi:MAG: outer membrane beta-barrel protein [Bacteroidia bacterium]|nr:outer membrane beta-barrel protein [Bacteroidia bacterium]MCF8446195.1 outer membrane beta-barrel protein [Bacteroidia bacterium]